MAHQENTRFHFKQKTLGDIQQIGRCHISQEIKGDAILDYRRTVLSVAWRRPSGDLASQVLGTSVHSSTRTGALYCLIHDVHILYIGYGWIWMDMVLVCLKQIHPVIYNGVFSEGSSQLVNGYRLIVHKLFLNHLGLYNSGWAYVVVWLGGGGSGKFSDFLISFLLYEIQILNVFFFFSWSVYNSRVDHKITNVPCTKQFRQPLSGILKLLRQGPRFFWISTRQKTKDILLKPHPKNSSIIKLILGTNSLTIYPIGSMYAIYGNIYHQYTPNVSIYTIHRSYGYG